MEKIKNKVILVFYIDIRKLDLEVAFDYMEKIKRAIKGNLINFEDVLCFIIPVDSETRIEAIYPDKISEEFLKEN